MSAPEPLSCPEMHDLPPEALTQVAAYFQVLSEPTRLRLLNLLRDGERNVGDLAAACECTAANVSRHLSVLSKQGLVTKEGRGTSVFYRMADPSVYALCDLVCGHIARQFERQALAQQAFMRPGRDQVTASAAAARKTKR